MTVSAFTEVSLDPPLVLVCIDKAANTQPVIEQGRVFAVNILARDQEPLARRFARKQDEERRFAGLDCEQGETGAPLITGCVASLDCRLVQSLEAGDHVIHVGRVVGVRLSDREPLMFHNRAYCGLAGN
jgi:flavin reductase (DIM6/NTAB) family NADH-FMN oxidoreductase RutF